MGKKIIIINSSAGNNSLLIQAFKELTDFSFSLKSSRQPLINQFKRQNWPTKKIFLGPELKNSFSALLFILICPFIWLKLFFLFTGLKLNGQADTIVCLAAKEKIAASLAARLLKLRVVWLENPEEDYRGFGRILFWFYKINSRLARVAVFSSFSGARLADADKIKMISPGVKPAVYQENIFNKLAAGQADYRRKYFTIGSITDLNQKQKIETIFQAVKISLPLIANLQLVIIGDGAERKNLLWLAKKLNIENLVWLVGEQTELKKWLDSFDVFLSAGDRLKLDDYGNLLAAMAAGLPVLAPRNTGAEDLVLENKTGALIEPDNSEMLARQIIKLHQDEKLRLALGRNGRERVAAQFTLDKMAGQLRQLL